MARSGGPTSDANRGTEARCGVALAGTHTLTVLTADTNIGKYPGTKTLW
jgi:hypothetical protein